MEWYVDDYGRDSELCRAVALGIDEEDSCWLCEDCLHCQYSKDTVDNSKEM